MDLLGRASQALCTILSTPTTRIQTPQCCWDGTQRSVYFKVPLKVNSSVIIQLNYQNGLSGPIPNVFQKADFINQLIKILKHNQLFVEKFQDAFSLEKAR